MNWKLPKQLTIEWSTAARRQRDRLGAADLEKIKKHINRFAKDRHGDVVPLKGTADPVEFRLKFKPWRVLFTIELATSTMHILSVARRDESTYRR